MSKYDYQIKTYPELFYVQRSINEDKRAGLSIIRNLCPLGRELYIAQALYGHRRMLKSLSVFPGLRVS